MTDPQFERDRLEGTQAKGNKWAWCLAMLCWTLTLTDRREWGNGLTDLCLPGKAYLGRQAQRPQHLMVALLARHPLLSVGASGGPAPGLHSMWALLHRHPCSTQRCHPRPALPTESLCAFIYSLGGSQAPTMCQALPQAQGIQKRTKHTPTHSELEVQGK